MVAWVCVRGTRRTRRVNSVQPKLCYRPETHQMLQILDLLDAVVAQIELFQLRVGVQAFDLQQSIALKRDKAKHSSQK